MNNLVLKRILSSIGWILLALGTYDIIISMGWFTPTIGAGVISVVIALAILGMEVIR